MITIVYIIMKISPPVIRDLINFSGVKKSLYLWAIAGFGLVQVAMADVLTQNLTSWHTESTGKYARIFETLADETAGTAVTTWSRGQGVQTMPTYAGVHEVSYTNDSIYVRTTGLGSHIMGPWYLNEANTNLFPNYPANQAIVYRLPREQGPPPVDKVLTGLGRIGIFVDGVSMFDSRDAFSYDTSAGRDDSPNAGAGVSGDDIWNRDAFVNERVTFDSANAHQAGANYHYHANPPALRHQLGDSVDYDEVENRYTENFNGEHSPILGWVSDGYPLYGPYGYGEAMNPESSVVRMNSGFQLRSITQRLSLPAFAARDQAISEILDTSQYGPDVSNQFVLGHYLEDYEYRGDLGEVLGVDFDLDEHNGRFCVTPEFPKGTYAYFVSIEEDGTPKFPYNIGRKFYGSPTGTVVATVPDEATVVFEGGTERELKGDVTVMNTDEVTVRWSAVEGGSYVVEASPNLDDWGAISAMQDLDEVIVNEQALDEKKFYRTTTLDIASFDDEGFVIGDVASREKHNILLIIVDDWGVDSSPLDNLTVSNHASMPTFASLASQGVRFTNAYAQPTCSPTRAGILTGRYSFRHGVGSPGGVNFPESEFTLPDAFAAANSNYSLMSVGKWHLGGGDSGPNDVGGWDEFSGSLNAGVNSYYDWEKTVNGVTTSNVATYTTTDQVNDAVSFISGQGDQPWMCWLAFNAPHSPLDEPPSNLIPSGATGGDRRGLYERLLEAMDTELARLLESVDLAKTNILLIGDNGTPGNVVLPPYDAGTAKGTLYEGGIRVPFIAFGPDVRARGTRDDVVHCSDLYTTILDLAGIELSAVLPEGTVVDGRSLFGVMNGIGSVEGGAVSENFGNVTDPGRAIRIGDFKLIIYDDGREELYNVVDDPSEENELIGQGLDVSQQMAYDALQARNAALSVDGGSTNAAGVLSVSPDTGMTGSSVRITFNLDPNTMNPTVPGLARTLASVKLGTISGTSITRSSRYVVEADFVLPSQAGAYDVEMIFTGPEMRTFGLSDAFTVE